MKDTTLEILDKYEELRVYSRVCICREAGK